MKLVKESLNESVLTEENIKKTKAYKWLMERIKEYKEKKPDKGHDWAAKRAQYDFSAKYNKDWDRAAAEEIYDAKGLSY